MTDDRKGASSLSEGVDAAVADFNAVGLIFDADIVRRFLASLIAKRFVILTGLSGSGKTRLAQAFAIWASPVGHRQRQRFGEGSKIRSDRITYIVSDTDRLSAEFWNNPDPHQAIRIALPWALIDQWVECIERHGLKRETPARRIRELVDEEYGQYSAQLNSFETVLKAAAFALLESDHVNVESQNYEVVAVGADWTTNEHVVGYADALHDGRFVRTQVLDLLLRAHGSPGRPYFLILDEMNLAHVERYFADFLSAMESGEPLVLHSAVAAIDGVPPRLTIPTNLFVVGTVNVDETTYMFSPKVLDRANAIEFRVTSHQVNAALSSDGSMKLGELGGRGAQHLTDFVRIANQPVPILHSQQVILSTEMMMLFEILEGFGHEFGLRVAREVSRFFGALRLLEADFDASYAFDAQIYQKILPRLSGSRAQLEPVLLALASFCISSRQWEHLESDTPILTNSDSIVDAARQSAEGFDESVFADSGSIVYPLTFAKLQRMQKRLLRNGFTSFAEA